MRIESLPFVAYAYTRVLRVTNYADNAGGAQTSSPPSFSPSFFDVSTYILLQRYDVVAKRRRREENSVATRGNGLKENEGFVRRSIVYVYV